ncbi:hypothetical protein K439DRAFT_1398478 [Ramaria rubella]|nr:hypothetical protein K439DRAFT_1398478 [Ramaria rubella]
MSAHAPLRALARALTTASPSVAAATPKASTASLPSALSLLKSQPSHYIVASLHQRRYLLTPKDLLTVPRMRSVAVGDVLRLSKIHELGSRDYTLRGDPLIPPDTVMVNATVVEHTKGVMEHIFKKKRRKGYQKHIQHKQGYTRLRIGPIDILDPPVEQKNSIPV